MDDEKKTCCCGCSQRKKERTPEEYKRLIHRLNRIEGQIRGIRGMVENDAYCPDILVQSAAAPGRARRTPRTVLLSCQYPAHERDAAPPHTQTAVFSSISSRSAGINILPRAEKHRRRFFPAAVFFYVLLRSSRYSSPPSVITA